MRMTDSTIPAYAGVGSRQTPDHVLSWMRGLGSLLSSLGYRLRSGRAPGADLAFEAGCVEQVAVDPAAAGADLFVPWAAFQSHIPLPADPRIRVHTSAPPQARDLVYDFHPAPDRLSSGAFALMARNTQQVLGPDLTQPARFVVCWTPDATEVRTSRQTGGTGMAIRIAFAYGVPVFNLGRPDAGERLAALLNAERRG